MAAADDRRLYRHAAGDEAHLTGERATGAGGVAWWLVTLVRADSSVAPLAGQPAVAWRRMQQAARECYKERLRALRDAGWQRVE